MSEVFTNTITNVPQAAMENLKPEMIMPSHSPDPLRGIARETVVYTAMSRGYDLLKAPECKAGPGTAFVAFTEDLEGVRGWQMRPLHAGFNDPCRNAKIHKILPHLYFPDAAYSLWVDGSVGLKLKMPVEELIATYLAEHDLAVFNHPSRNCIYAEAEECILCGKDSPDIIREQMRKYRHEAYPQAAGLVESGVLLRRHTERTRLFNEAWWAEISRHSRRDQLSFNYVAWKLAFDYKPLPGFVEKNDFFELSRHLAISTAGSPAPDSSGEETCISGPRLDTAKPEPLPLSLMLHSANLQVHEAKESKVRLLLKPFRLLEKAIRMRRKRLMKAFCCRLFSTPRWPAQ